MTSIRGILFDKDGTLLDYHASWSSLNRDVATYAARGDAALTAELMALAGHDAATDRVRSGSHFAAATNVEIAQLFARHLGSDAPDDIADAVERIFISGGAQSVMVAGCIETLAQLQAMGITLGVATNDSSMGLESSLAPHGIRDAFGFSAGFDSGYGKKPDPGQVNGFCDAAGLQPGEVAMVGDNAHDIEAGRNAGVGLTVGVLTGTSTRTELESLADIVLESIAGLPEVLAHRR